MTMTETWPNRCHFGLNKHVHMSDSFGGVTGRSCSKCPSLDYREDLPWSEVQEVHSES